MTHTHDPVAESPRITEPDSVTVERYMATSREAIGKALRSARLGMGVTQHDLATAAGVTGPYVCRVEQGDRRPTIPTILAMAARLNMSIEDLVSPTKTVVWLARLTQREVETTEVFADLARAEKWAAAAIDTDAWNHFAEAMTRRGTPTPDRATAPAADVLECWFGAPTITFDPDGSASAVAYGTGQTSLAIEARELR